MKAGDRVRIYTKDKVWEGILMERPKIIKGDFIILKLDSGYNIGISKKRIRKIEIVERMKRVKKKIKVKKEGDIAIISTGGTISSMVDYETGGTHALITADDFFEIFPELERYDIVPINLMLKMSEDMQPNDWRKIGRSASKQLKMGRSVIITHGTDTMHFTSAALAFFFQSLNKPIILTGAQRSIDRGSTDAYLNLICSCYAAKQEIGEVMVCMHASSNDDFCYLHYGTRVRKMHTSARYAFQSINSKPIAKVWPDAIEFLANDYRKFSELEYDDKINPNVALVYFYPGLKRELFQYIVDMHDGIVIAGTGLGHVCSSGKNNLIPIIRKAIKDGKPVCMTSQCYYGSTHPFVYSNLRKLSFAGVIFCKDMLPHVAYIKLMWVLKHAEDMDEIKRLMQKPLAHECRI